MQWLKPLCLFFKGNSNERPLLHSILEGLFVHTLVYLLFSYMPFFLTMLLLLSRAKC
uniref:Uncharacterized protein n=1 Tax=Rhizophora mucronata TaxID=61149 RepID=A0A2P2QXW7_RHIMU